MEARNDVMNKGTVLRWNKCIQTRFSASTKSRQMQFVIAKKCYLFYNVQHSTTLCENTSFFVYKCNKVMKNNTS